MRDQDRLAELVTLALSALVTMALIWWMETPPWKREMFLKRLTGARVVPVTYPVELAIREFGREISRWEHAQQTGN